MGAETDKEAKRQSKGDEQWYKIYALWCRLDQNRINSKEVEDV